MKSVCLALVVSLAAVASGCSMGSLVHRHQGDCAAGGCGDRGCRACGGRGCDSCGRGGCRPGPSHMTGHHACGDDQCRFCQPKAAPEMAAAVPVTWPYYTVRGPRDFLAENPRGIGN